MRVPMLVHKTGADAFRVCMTPPDGTSQSLRVVSHDEEMMFLPSPIMQADATDRVCARRTRTGCTLVPSPEDDSDHVSGNSADRMERAKSAPHVRRTREDGKNLREVTLEACGFETSLRLVVLTCWMLGALGKGDGLGGRGVVG